MVTNILSSGKAMNVQSKFVNYDERKVSNIQVIYDSICQTILLLL